MKMNRRYHVPLEIDEARHAVRKAVMELSWPLESDDGTVLRVHTVATKSTRMTITLVPGAAGTDLEIAARLFGFGPWVERDLGGRINQLANAVSVTSGVSLR